MSASKLSREEVQRLYEVYGRGLLAYAVALVTSFGSAEDVVHTVFERLLRGDIAIIGPPAPYLYRAARNASFNSIRRRSREVELQEESWLESPAGMEEDAMTLQSALKGLPAEQREIIALHIWGELTFNEAAVVLGISPNTAASRYRYGLSKLREILKTSARDRYGLAK